MERHPVRTELLAAGGAFVLLVLLVVLNEAGAQFLVLPRLGLAMVVLLTLPGYFWHVALFPGADSAEEWERIALTIGLSVASIPVLTLVLDGVLRIPMRLEWLLPGVAVWAALGAVIAHIRRQRLPAQYRFRLRVPFAETWHSLLRDRTGTVLTLIGLGALSVAAIALAVTFSVPGPAQYFTEFYLLGDAGLAEAYPSQLQVSQPASFAPVIVNGENETIRYTVSAGIGQETLTQSDLVTLGPGEQATIPLTIVPEVAGNAQVLEIQLWRDGVADPYRLLRLWVDVAPAESAPGGG